MDFIISPEPRATTDDFSSDSDHYSIATVRIPLNYWLSSVLQIFMKCLSPDIFGRRPICSFLPCDAAANAVLEVITLSVCLSVTLRKSVEVGVFRRGWVSFSANFRLKVALPTNQALLSVDLWKPEWLPIRVVLKYLQCIVWFCFTCIINLLTYLLTYLSQSTRVTDRRADGQTDGQNNDSVNRV